LYRKRKKVTVGHLVRYTSAAPKATNWVKAAGLVAPMQLFILLTVQRGDQKPADGFLFEQRNWKRQWSRSTR